MECKGDIRNSLILSCLQWCFSVYLPSSKFMKDWLERSNELPLREKLAWRSYTAEEGVTLQGRSQENKYPDLTLLLLLVFCQIKLPLTQLTGNQRWMQPYWCNPYKSVCSRRQQCGEGLGVEVNGANGRYPALIICQCSNKSLEFDSPQASLTASITVDSS